MQALTANEGFNLSVLSIHFKILLLLPLNIILSSRELAGNPLGMLVLIFMIYCR